MMNDDHDKGKLMAEDEKMKAKQELTSASKTTINEPNATAAPDALDDSVFESSLNNGELEVIPEGRMKAVRMPWTLTTKAIRSTPRTIRAYLS